MKKIVSLLILCLTITACGAKGLQAERTGVSSGERIEKVEDKNGVNKIK